MRMIYTAALTPQENSSGYYARIPDVPGCVTTGAATCPKPLTTSRTRSAAVCACWRTSTSHYLLRVPRRLSRMSPAWCMRSLAWILSNTAWKPIHMPFARMYPFPHGWLRWPISGVSTARRCFRMHFATCSGGRNVDRTNIYKERPSPGRSFGSTGSKRGAGGMEPSDGSAAFSHLAQSK